jgi:hypothetical protein
MLAPTQPRIGAILSVGAPWRHFVGAGHSKRKGAYMLEMTLGLLLLLTAIYFISKK